MCQGILSSRLFYKACNLPQFIIRVVTGGDDQGSDFYPNTEPVVKRYGI